MTSSCSLTQSDKRKDTAETKIIYQQKSPQWVKNPVNFVDPLIGTEGVFDHRQAANVSPGVALPYGMVNFGPEHAYTEDLLAENKRSHRWVIEERKRMPVSAGGYNYAASRIKGFSLTRLSGTGCLGASGDIPFLPFNKDIKHSPDNDFLDAYYSASFSHENERAEPGYYQVKMGNGINVKLSATLRSGIAEFDFPTVEKAKLLIRSSYSQLGSGNAYTQVDQEKNEIHGYVTSGNFCGYLGEHNRRDYYTLHFVAKLDADIVSSGSWKDSQVYSDANNVSGGMGYGENGVPDLGKGSGMWVNLDLSRNKTVTMRVGISYVSLKNARENLKAEQAANSTFDDIRIKAQKAWNNALQKVKVESNDKRKLTTFYTALYHSQFHPNIFSDVNGEYYGFDKTVHRVKSPQQAQYANFSGWDVYRSQLQLVTLLDQKRAGDIAQSLFNQANQYNGIWDRWTHNSGATGVMNGDPATIAMANFAAFGAQDVNYHDIFASLKKAATEPTEFDLSSTGCPVFCRGQRPSLDQWLSLNYISDQSNSWEGASETLEQVSADFALGQLAKRLGHDEDYHSFTHRSGYWKNIFNPDATKEHGFIQGKNKDGSWKKDFDPANEGLFVEGSPTQYLWMIPFDGSGLMELLGGEQIMTERLDRLFRKPDQSWVLFRDSGNYADVSNQPSINSPWMYLFTGNAYKTQLTVRETLKQLWNDSPKGIPGQDDAGQMSSWYVFSSLGIYPLYPGRADLVLSSPVFSAAQIGNLTITTNSSSARDKYIKSLTINEIPTKKSWIDDSYINQPVHLDFTLSDKPNIEFGASKSDRPHSYSTSKVDD
ncbi:glycoside hydrolase family 92 protein [Aliikangiella coralliicola]|uniref:Glycoside hydrolase family 92 protein n=2 Tax=Aliikangiella coralliicola TaxID=2592383 RepID=A0A545U983_9GAMM|nr:glycoside hydrolase family 92 protein [Aliikangiella coralliicola]